MHRQQGKGIRWLEFGQVGEAVGKRERWLGKKGGEEVGGSDGIIEI